MILLPALALIISCSQSGYTITGEIKANDISVDSVFMYDQNGKTLASAPVKNNKFVLKGKTDEPQKVAVGNVALNFSASLILENESYTFVMDNTKALIRGGKLHNTVLGFVNSDAYQKAFDEYINLQIKQADAYEKGDTAKTEELGKLVTEKEDVMMAIEDKHFAELLGGNYPTLTKLFALNESQDWKGYPVEKRLQMLDEYEKELGKNDFINYYREYLTSEQTMSTNAEAVAAGMPFINVTAQNKAKESVELSTVVTNNKYTLLDFWASWCGPCRAEIPNLKKAYEKYKSKGFEIYAISLDDKEADWTKALDEEKTAWINVLNATGFKGEAVTSYGVQGIPSSFLIGQDGKIVVANDELRGENLEKTLEKLFK